MYYVDEAPTHSAPRGHRVFRRDTNQEYVNIDGGTAWALCREWAEQSKTALSGSAANVSIESLPRGEIHRFRGRNLIADSTTVQLMARLKVGSTSLTDSAYNSLTDGIRSNMGGVGSHQEQYMSHAAQWVLSSITNAGDDMTSNAAADLDAMGFNFDLLIDMDDSPSNGNVIPIVMWGHMWGSFNDSTPPLAGFAVSFKGIYYDTDQAIDGIEFYTSSNAFEDQGFIAADLRGSDLNG